MLGKQRLMESCSAKLLSFSSIRSFSFPFHPQLLWTFIRETGKEKEKKKRGKEEKDRDVGSDCYLTSYSSLIRGSSRPHNVGKGSDDDGSPLSVMMIR